MGGGCRYWKEFCLSNMVGFGNRYNMKYKANVLQPIKPYGLLSERGFASEGRFQFVV